MKVKCFIEESGFVDKGEYLCRDWRMFMVKLWNHGLLDARTMDKCNVILEELQP